MFARTLTIQHIYDSLRTTIDHILIDKTFIKHCTKFKSANNIAIITSDHLPLFVTVALPQTNRSSNPHTYENNYDPVAWKKCRDSELKEYSEFLAHKLKFFCPTSHSKRSPQLSISEIVYNNISYNSENITDGFEPYFSSIFNYNTPDQKHVLQASVDKDMQKYVSQTHLRGHQTSPTIVSLKGRLPEIMQSKPTLSCDIIQIYSLFRHGLIKKPKSKFNRNRTFCSAVTDFEKQILVLILFQMLFEGRYKTQDYFRYFLHLFSIPSFIFPKNGRGLILVYPQRIV